MRKKFVALLCFLLILVGCTEPQVTTSFPEESVATSLAESSRASLASRQTISKRPSSKPESKAEEPEERVVLLEETPDARVYRVICSTDYSNENGRTSIAIEDRQDIVITVTFPGTWVLEGTIIHDESKPNEEYGGYTKVGELFTAIRLVEGFTPEDFLVAWHGEADFEELLERSTYTDSLGRTIFYDIMHSTYNGPVDIVTFLVPLQDDIMCQIHYYMWGGMEDGDFATLSKAASSIQLYDE